MLIKVGVHRINLAHIACVTEDNGDRAAILIRFVSGDSIELQTAYAADFLNAWDKWADFQSDVQEMNEFTVKSTLANIEAAQNKSGIVIPKMTTPRGRG